MDLKSYWTAVIMQNVQEMRKFFHPEAQILWHNSNEKFNVDEFLRANCEYPGTWDGSIVRTEKSGEIWITVTHIFSKDRKETISVHAISFFEIRDDKIIRLDEYWSDDGEIPEWRKQMRIGAKIK